MPLSKHYNKAPLPLTGQKRNFIKPFKKALEHIPADGAGWTIVDAFGGSGLLAHIAKHCKPAARVIYNDFDNYAERIKNIKHTNSLRQQLLTIVQHLPNDQRLNPNTKKQIIQTIQQHNGYIDLPSLNSWLLFSGQQVSTLEELYSHNFYNCIRQSNIPTAGDYLTGLEITHQPFDILLPKYHQQKQTLLILDPPYVATNQRAYAKPNYFGMVQFLRLMSLLRPPYILFSSTRSELIEYIKYIKDTNYPEYQAKFAGTTYSRLNVQISKNTCYEDNMLIKF